MIFNVHSAQQRMQSIALVAAAAAALAGCGTSVTRITPEKPSWTETQTFSARHWRQFPAPSEAERVQTLSLFGTYYYTPTHGYMPGGTPILDIAGQPLGPRLSTTAFCNAADEGAFRAASLN